MKPNQAGGPVLVQFATGYRLNPALDLASSMAFSSSGLSLPAPRRMTSVIILPVNLNGTW